MESGRILRGMLLAPGTRGWAYSPELGVRQADVTWVSIPRAGLAAAPGAQVFAPLPPPNPLCYTPLHRAMFRAGVRWIAIY